MSDAEEVDAKSPLRASFESSRSLLKSLIALAIFGVVVFYYFSHRIVGKPHSAELPAPAMVSPAGGNTQIKKLDQLASQQDQQASLEAQKSGKSYTASLTGKELPSPTIIPELGAGTTKPHKTEPSVAQTDKPAQPASSNPFIDPVGPRNITPRNERSGTTATQHLSTQAEVELLEAWAGRPASIERVSTNYKSPVNRSVGSDKDVSTHTVTATSVGNVSADSGKSKTHGTLLLAGGRGVYGHSVLTSNSDLGHEVLVEVDTGPFRKARISGTFSMQNDKLIIKFNTLMIGDNDPISVSAYAVSPETAETGVASEVNEHLATRIILPAASAFVQGLGNAMMSANTSSYTGGYGMTSFTHLNIAQQMGAAAGNLGQEMGQLLQKQTPQTATVKLDKGDTVGILFDQPVYGP